MPSMPLIVDRIASTTYHTHKRVSTGSAAMRVMALPQAWSHIGRYGRAWASCACVPHLRRRMLQEGLYHAYITLLYVVQQEPAPIFGSGAVASSDRARPLPTGPPASPALPPDACSVLGHAHSARAVRQLRQPGPVAERHPQCNEHTV